MVTGVSPAVDGHSPPESPAAPFMSIVVPVYRTPLGYLAELLKSVAAQTDPDWELILVDDGSADETLTATLAAAAAGDPRIRVETLPVNSGIAVASNRGVALAGGRFVALLDHDDVLAPDAVDACRRVVRATPDVDVMYSDETIVGAEGELLGEFRKPVFSPERLRGQMYTCHLPVYRRSLLESIGGFRDGFAGSQDYDLVLRATERSTAVQTIPHSLYRWRILPTSVSHAEGKDFVFDGARRALSEHLDRVGVQATISLITEGLFRLSHWVPDDVQVEVILPSRGDRQFVDGADRIALPHTVQSLTESCGPRLRNVTVLVGDDRSAAMAETVVARVLPERARVDRVAGDPWSANAINEAVLAAAGPLVLLLRDGVTPVTENWLDVLLGVASGESIGLVGPRVLSWDNSVAAAGLALEDGSVHAIGAGLARTDPGPFGALQLGREVTALPADCVVLSRSAYLQVGGLTLKMPLAAAFIDLSLKMAEIHRRTIVTAACDVRVGSTSATIPRSSELGQLRERWGGRLAADAYWR